MDHEFSNNKEKSGGKDLGGICREFYALIDEMEGKIHHWTYLQRAWTFQVGVSYLILLGAALLYVQL